MIRDVVIPAKLCECDICHYRWVSTSAKPPESCRSRECRSREWNGGKRAWRGKEFDFPAPRKPGRPRTITLTDFNAEEPF